jgi:hypothetical protein
MGGPLCNRLSQRTVAVNDEACVQGVGIGTAYGSGRRDAQKNYDVCHLRSALKRKSWQRSTCRVHMKFKHFK